jgi:hypothetical protein
MDSLCQQKDQTTLTHNQQIMRSVAYLKNIKTKYKSIKERRLDYLSEPSKMCNHHLCGCSVAKPMSHQHQYPRQKARTRHQRRFSGSTRRQEGQPRGSLEVNGATGGGADDLWNATPLNRAAARVHHGGSRRSRRPWKICRREWAQDHAGVLRHP